MYAFVHKQKPRKAIKSKFSIGPPWVWSAQNHGTHAIPDLLHAVGKQAVTVGKSGDRYEQEADWAAKKVMHRGAAENSKPRTYFSYSIDAHRARRGRSLSPEVRHFFESRFGHSFADVRVHTDRSVGESALAMQSRAYTIGKDITFAPGEYQPGSQPGRQLLAHELAHVVQQTQRPAPANPNAIAAKLSSVSTPRLQRRIIPGPPSLPPELFQLNPLVADLAFRYLHGANNPLAILFFRNYMVNQYRPRDAIDPIILTRSQMSEVLPHFSIQTNYVGYTEGDKVQNQNFWQRWAVLMRSDVASMPIDITSRGFANLRGTLGIFTVHWEGELSKEALAGGVTGWQFVGQIRFTDTWDLNPGNRGDPELGVRLASILVPGRGFAIRSVRVAASERGTGSWNRNAVPVW